LASDKWKKNTFTLESEYKNAGLINNTTDMDIDNHADLYKKIDLIMMRFSDVSTLWNTSV